jgi:hypothetical protein
MRSMKHPLRLGAALALLAPAVATPAFASFQAAVRARPVQVEFGGTPTQQTMIVRGVFSMAYISGTDGYVAPTCGSVQWFCRGNDQQLCRMEWDEIASAAHDGACVSFGALMWQGATMAVDPYDHTVGMNPHNAEKGTGVVRIPCNPMPADLDRPNLTLVCPIAGTVEPSTPDAGAAVDAPTEPSGAFDAPAVTPPDAAAAAGGSGGAPGAGGAPGTGGAGTGGAVTGPELAEKDSGCSFAPGPGGGSALAFAGVAMGVALWRRGRRRRA